MNNESAEENIYYNVVINGKAGTSIPAIYNETRTESILENPSNYQLTIQRFYVPAFNIPILLFKDNYYSVSMTYGGTTITKPLIYTSFSIAPYPNPIYDYQHMVDIVNTAIEDAYNDLKALFPAGPPTEAPFITFNPTNKLFSLNAEQLYDPAVAGGATFELWFNFPLGSLFVGFQQFYNDISSPLNSRFIIKNNGNNTTTYNGKPYYSTEAEYNTLYLWNSLESIVFTTGSIPVVPENNSGQVALKQQVITDFIPLASINDRTAIQYYPQGALRWYDLQGSTPLRNIDVQVYWKDKTGQLYPVYIFETESLSIKIQFRKKLL